MKNWKTTLIGVLLGVGTFLEPIINTGHIDVAKTILGALMVALGIVAKDFNVTGGSVNQGTPPLK